MRFLLLAGFALALFLTGPAAAQNATNAVPPSAPAWKAYDNALADARKTQRPVLVMVYADWCGWCRKLDTEVYADPAVQAYLERNFEITRLDIESRRMVTHQGTSIRVNELTRTLGVSGVPGTVFLRPDGSYLNQFPGFAPADKFLTVLRFIGEKAFENESFEDFVKRTGG
jgi:thioredoxin-related protein